MSDTDIPSIDHLRASQGWQLVMVYLDNPLTVMTTVWCAGLAGQFMA